MSDTVASSLGRQVDEGPIVPTASAIVRAASLMAAEGDDSLVLAIAARPGGCSGMSWEMFFATPDDTDLDPESEVCTYTADDCSLTVVVDPTTAQLARGSTLDFNDGLNGTGFKINNPNAQRTCGCGQSFS